MDYVSDAEELKSREKMRPVFWILPLILSSVVVITLLVVKAVKGKSGIGWGGIILWCLFTEVVVWGLSMMIYLLTSIKEIKAKDREFNSPQRCDELLRDFLLKDTGYVVDDFSKTAESIYGSRWAGEGDAKEQERIYFHLYRLRVGALYRYLLCVINMDKSKADWYSIRQSPSNFQDLNKIVDEMSDQMCNRRKKMMTRERTYRDDVAGREETVREESPMDSSENGVDYDEQQ
jgi:hypothetical protein